MILSFNNWFTLFVICLGFMPWISERKLLASVSSSKKMGISLSTISFLLSITHFCSLSSHSIVSIQIVSNAGFCRVRDLGQNRCLSHFQDNFDHGGSILVILIGVIFFKPGNDDIPAGTGDALTKMIDQAEINLDYISE